MRPEIDTTAAQLQAIDLMMNSWRRVQSRKIVVRCASPEAVCYAVTGFYESPERAQQTSFFRKEGCVRHANSWTAQSKCRHATNYRSLKTLMSDSRLNLE